MIPVITIDGPSGAGKGTVGQKIAKELGWHFLDSGAIYRILGFATLEKNISLNDMDLLIKTANNLAITFLPNNSGIKIFLENKDISQTIRAEKYGKIASQIAVLPQVRQALLDKQRNFRQAPGLIADGRDMGTVVFLDAMLKFFITASSEKRAERRFWQLKSQGIESNLEEILLEIIKRDERDEKRVVAPLKPAVDAVIIDTTNMTIQEVYNQIKEIIFSM